MNNKFNAAKKYVHKNSIGNELEMRAKACEVVMPYLTGQYNNKIIDGVRILYIDSRETANYKLIFANYEKVTLDVYPFLYVAIQFFDASGNAEIEQFMLEHGFVPIYVE
jgi:hypothetical protein